ncbi:MAG: sigma-54 dependent transcriptional regulator [Acidobacteriota bacterium]
MSPGSSPSTARIALVEDDPAVRQTLAAILTAAGYFPETFESGDAFLQSGARTGFDVVLTDFQMEGTSGIDLLKACRADADPPEVLLVTGVGSIRHAVEAMRLGAFDYLSKPVEPKELLHRISQALETRNLKRSVAALSGEVRRRRGVDPPVSESPVMRGFLARAARVASSSSTVLILGETGTGKEVTARFIQRSGPRAERTYLELNCAAIPENLLETELFGHARGAFSGAHAMKRGLFEEASGGTLFLDEIGSMSLPAQAKMLRALEEGAVRRVGENQSIPIDVRIIAATNRDLHAAVAAGEFREDLYYRLAVVTLVVPALRERREDIEPLARTFLAESVRRLGKLRIFAPETIEFLKSHPFPGNIRELRYAIEQAAILSEDTALRPADFPFRPGAGSPSGGRRPRTGVISRERIEQALRESGGSRVAAARALGVSRATFYRLLDRPAKTEAEPGPSGPSGDV